MLLVCNIMGRKQNESFHKEKETTYFDSTEPELITKQKKKIGIWKSIANQKNPVF